MTVKNVIVIFYWKSHFSKLMSPLWRNSIWCVINSCFHALHSNQYQWNFIFLFATSFNAQTFFLTGLNEIVYGESEFDVVVCWHCPRLCTVMTFTDNTVCILMGKESVTKKAINVILVVHMMNEGFGTQSQSIFQ